MSVGLVIVSHSAKIAEGVVELAAQMASAITIVAAGGTDDDGIGTSFERIDAGVRSAQQGDGVVILCDLGSAVMTAETVVEFLDEAEQQLVRIADAPVVEGAVAAAVAAASGGDLGAVAAAAESAAGTVGAPATGESARVSDDADDASGARDAPVTARITLRNTAGLHARPAAEFVKLASSFDADIRIEQKDAKSLLGIMSLGLAQGASATISGTGPQAAAAVAALVELVESSFGEA